LRDAVVAFITDFIPGIFPENGSPGLVDPDSLEPTAATGLVGLIALVFLLRTATTYLSNLRIGVRTMLGGARLGGLVGKAWDALALVVLFVVILLATAIQVVGASFANALAEALGDDTTSPWVVRAPAILAGFIADAGFVALVYLVLGRARGPKRMIVAVIAVAAAAIVVVQQLSALFVGSAADNVVLAPFAAVIVVVLFATLVAQILLYGAAWLGVGIPAHVTRAPEPLPPYPRRNRGGVTTTRAVGRLAHRSKDAKAPAGR
jgi:membrane protein